MTDKDIEKIRTTIRHKVEVLAGGHMTKEELRTHRATVVNIRLDNMRILYQASLEWIRNFAATVPYADCWYKQRQIDTITNFILEEVLQSIREHQMQLFSKADQYVMVKEILGHVDYAYYNQDLPINPHYHRKRSDEIAGLPNIKEII